MNYDKKAVALHKKNRGKIEIKSKVPLSNSEDLSLAYTPGVAGVCNEIFKNKKLSFELTNRANTVAIISDGTAILGLGNIGPEAGMPVMEGKSAIFKEFADVDAYPICIKADNVDDIVRFCEMIEPSVGGINLEDISAPNCFDVLKRLEDKLSIPVFHDDQDGTAIVVLAALINACKITGKKLEKLNVVINGAGAAGLSVARLLLARGVKDIVVLDSVGAIYQGRTGLNGYKKEMAMKTNKLKIKGKLEEVMVNRDVFVGVSKAGVLNADMVKSMNEGPIIFAMANPNPEIMPDIALKAGASVVGTGRSDFANQINNALVFPGIFRGLLDAKIRKVTTKMKIESAVALANVVKKPTKDNLLPKITDRKVVKAIRNAIVNSK